MLRARAVVVLSGLAWSLLPATAPATSEPWQWPLAGAHEVSRAFAPPATSFGAGHRGVDLPGEPGAVVRAAGAGRVSYAGMLAGRGVVVVVHGELRTTYEPVAALHPVGTSVAAGEPIGRLEAGHLGCPAAACLHWGLRRGEQYLDPTRLVDRGPVRLLPVAGVGAWPPTDSLINAGVHPLPPPAEERRGGVDQPRTSQSAPASPPEVAEPAWSLTAGELPLGGLAVLALVLGLGLLTRPRPRPDADPSGSGAAAPAARPAAEAVAQVRPVLDLDEARLRRRTG